MSRLCLFAAEVPCRDRIGLLNVLLAEGINLGVSQIQPIIGGAVRAMGKTIRAQSPPFLGRLKLPPTLRTRPRFTTWTIRNRRPTRERWSVVVNGYGVVSHPSGLPIKKGPHIPNTH